VAEPINSYDEVPYASHPFAQTHPDRLAAIATMLGLDPPAVDRCRVLELGCASGGNLIPMAEGLPNASFLGIDLSEKQVVQGQEQITSLRLTNLELRHMDIATASADLGTFDYVICHGVFSWVARPVQEKILSLCEELLSPKGIAYISYNTLPGWRMRGTIRDMMLFHAGAISSPQQRVEQAVALLKFMAEAAVKQNTSYGNFLTSELELLRHTTESYVFHDHLEEHNDPLYFHQFVERAATHGLRYVGEAEVPTMVPDHFSPEVSEVLNRLSPDQVRLEQYLDFLRNRTFRQTLLCRATEQPNYKVAAQRLTLLNVASPMRPVSATPRLERGVEEEFHGPDDLRIQSGEPIVKAALTLLGEAWPQSIPFARLRALASERVRPGPLHDSTAIRQETEILASTLWRFYATASTQVLHLTTTPFRGTRRIGERPVARPLARWQAERGEYVTNLLHGITPLREGERRLLAGLDGQHDENALLQILEASLARGELTVQEQGEPVTNPQRIRELLREALTATLADFVRSALMAA
jgi:methyltransferase-like protein/2-polyprenyl-3-methyl-5-hydroxy-6-metoxy-1,4-benzoquinol methylase